MLGTDNPCAHPKNSGWWNLFSIKPYSEAQQLLEINDTWQRGWVGDGVGSMYSIFDRGQAVVMLLAGLDQDPGEAYTRPVSADEIRQICHDWPPRLLKAIEAVRTPSSLQDIGGLLMRCVKITSSSVRNPNRPRCTSGNMRSRLLRTVPGPCVC